MAVNEQLLLEVLEQIRPNLQADGGDMAYVGVTDEGVVQLELQGACAGCPMSSLTLSMGIERILKRARARCDARRAGRRRRGCRKRLCMTSTLRFRIA